MKFPKINSGFFIAFVLLVVSCDGSNNAYHNTEHENKVNVDSLLLEQHKVIFSGLKQQLQKFTMNTETEQQITGLNGTIITIQKGCFDVHDIVVELVECYSKMDMIKNALSTITTDGKLLESQGMLYLNVTDKEGNTLVPKVGKLNIKVPIEPDTDCKFFNGVEQKGIIVWKENQQVSISKVKPTPKKEKIKYPKFLYTYLNKNRDTIRDTVWGYQYKEVVASMNVFYSMFNPVSLGWYNLDRYEESERVDFVSNNTLNDACIVVMIPQELNTVLHCAPSMNYQERGLTISKIPNMNADFLFLRYEDDHFKYDIVTYQKGAEKTLNVKLETINIEELNELLKQRYGKKFTNGING